MASPEFVMRVAAAVCNRHADLPHGLADTIRRHGSALPASPFLTTATHRLHLLSTMKKRTAKKTAKPVIPTENSVYQLKITLIESSPPVWRQVLVPGDYVMEDLHEVIQFVMGWEDFHMHQFVFRAKGRLTFVRSDEDDYDEMGPPGSVVLNGLDHTLAELAPQRHLKFVYEYDFGDSWEHEILVEDILPADPAAPAPRCLAGANACPPEDCGGVWGYKSILEALADPKHPEHEEATEWFEEDFDPTHFDLDKVNQELADGFE